MNDELVRLWNEKVPKDATVIHMGDFAFGRCTPNDVAGIVKSLNGKIIFIEGNHDHATVMKAHYKWNIFTEVHKELDIRVITDEEHPGDYIDIHCSHFPKLVWNRKHYGAWHAFGHCHSTRPIRHQDFNQHDCGVDGNGYAPISIKEFGSIITTRHLVGWEK
jgi:calcineurin-like phosphoesterase family protein